MSTTHDEPKTTPGMDILQAAALASTTAREKGWLDRPRSVAEVFALFHSELSEALEAYRDGCTARSATLKDGKPEGIPAELADFVIRVIEWCETDCHPDVLMAIVTGHPFPEDCVTFPQFIVELHAAVSESYTAEVEGRVERMTDILALSVLRTFWYCQREGIDLEGAIHLKQAYNTTRPQRHGGKVI
jgi:hypothetical protein